MNNLFSLLILLVPISVFSQVQMEETLDTSIFPKNFIVLDDTAKLANNIEVQEWFDILKTNFNNMEKSGKDTVLLDSVYTFKFYSQNDSILLLKQYTNYIFNENKITVSKFISDSVSGEWLHFNENEYYYDYLWNDSLLITDVKDTISNTWFHNTKTEYDFDSYGNEIYYAFYRWNKSLNQWIGSSKTVRDYNEKNNLLLSETFSWDNDSNKWDMTTKHEYAFDSGGNKILDVFYGRDWQTNKLTPSYKYEHEFDEFGNRIMDASYNWDSAKEQWRGTSKNESIYDENGNQILYYYYTWDAENDEWKNHQKSESAYNEKRFIISSAVYLWNDNLKQWQGNWKRDLEFDANGKDTVRVDYEWSIEDNAWYKKSKTVSSYFKPELYPSTIIYKWNKELNDWELDKKTDLGFDENDQLILETDYIWNDSLKVWKGDTKTEITMNSNGDQTETIRYEFKEIKSFFEENIKIFSFDSDSLINKTPTEFCSEQISVQDTDFVEGTGSILWEYQIGELKKWEDGCKIGIKNDKDLSNEEGFHFDFKVINPTNANFVVLFKEKSGELWLFEDMDLLANTSKLWKSPGLPFNELELVENEEKENGILDLNKIDSVQFLIYDLQEKNISGSLLLDNLGTSGYQDTSFWNITNKNENIYDDYGNRIYERYYNSNNDSLKIYSQNKYDITYDDNGNQTSNAQYLWNSITDNWFGISKTEMTYDDSGRIISEIRYFWDYEKEEWYGNRKRKISYDKNGNKTREAYIYWDETTNSWLPNYKTENYYNNDNERTKHIYYYWNNDAKEWEVEYINLFTKDNYILDDKDKIILYETIQWDENLLKWSAVEKNYFYYSTHQLNPITTQKYISEINDVRVYPNPFKEKLIIETKSEEMELVVFDISGKIIINRKLHSLRNEINLNELNNGLYMIRLYNSKKIVYKQKVIKQ